MCRFAVETHTTLRVTSMMLSNDWDSQREVLKKIKEVSSGSGNLWICDTLSLNVQVVGQSGQRMLILVASSVNVSDISNFATSDS